MVLGAYLSPARLLAATLAVTACAAAADDDTNRMVSAPAGSPSVAGSAAESVAVGPRTLRLSEGSDGCRIGLKASAESAPLAVGPPCFFLRSEGDVQIFSYPARGVEAVMMVAGGAVSEEQRQRWKLAPDARCGTTAQAVVVSRGAMRVSGRVLSGGVYCRDHGLDEKDFGAAAREP